MKLRQVAYIALVVLFCACRRLATSPAPLSDNSRIELAAKERARAFPERDRPEFLQGFINGAQMVGASLKLGQRPFLPRMGSDASPAIPLGKLPAGAQVQVEVPKVEMDPETGLVYAFLYVDERRAFAQGQMAGFSWAFEGHRAVLTQPKPVPVLPPTWEEWPAEGGLVVKSNSLQVECSHSCGLLAWSLQEQGFPPRRRWRSLPEAMRPHHVALSGDALWIDTGSGAIAIDLETGAIRNVLPTQPHDATSGSSWDAIQARQKEEVKRERPGLLAKAQAGDVKAMSDLGYMADDLAEAASWFRQAAEVGDPQGMYEWAIRLYQGRGVAEDRQAAKGWLEKAALAGHPTAKAVLDGLFPPK